MLLSFKNCGTTCTDEFSSSSSSSSSSVVASNNDLLVQILLRLPVKSLLVFKTVSKQWLSLISNQYFVRNHFLQHRSSIVVGLLVLKQSSVESNSDYEFIFPDENVYSSRGPGSFPFNTLDGTQARISIVRSCNGLLICQRFCRSTYESTYYVYNPSTMHYKILPLSPFRKHDYNNRINLAFDPIKSPHYKAICIWWKDGNNNQLEIYSSETDSWRLWGGVFISVENARYNIFDKPGVYWNGSLHWVSKSRDPSLYFDIDRELMRTMPMPSLPYVDPGGRCIKYVGAYKDHLHLIEIYPHMNGCFDILEMNTDYSGWNVKFRLDINDFIRVPHPDIDWGDIGISYVLSGYGFDILKFFDEEDQEGESSSSSSSKLVIQMWTGSLNILSYDLKEMVFKKISSGSSWRHGWTTSHLYIPTLARV